LVLKKALLPKMEKRDMITISIGVHHLDCFLSSKPFALLDSEMLSLYSVICINHVSSITHMQAITIRIMDGLVLLSLDCIVGSLVSYMKLTPKHTANDMTNSAHKRQRCEESNKIKNYFYLHHDEAMNSEVPLCHPSEF